MDSLLSTKVISLAWLVDGELVFEAKNGFGQEGKAREGTVRLKVEVKAATTSASWAAGKRICPSGPSSRREMALFLDSAGVLCERFENGASVPLEMFSISQKLKAEAAVPNMKLVCKFSMEFIGFCNNISYLALSNPRIHALLSTGFPAESRVPVHSIGVKAPT